MNHEVPCRYCGEDTRGLYGVRGCFDSKDTSTCNYYREYMKRLKEWEEKEKS